MAGRKNLKDLEKLNDKLAKKKFSSPSLGMGKFLPTIGGFAEYAVSLDYDTDDLKEDVAPIIKEYTDLMPKAAVALKQRLDMALMAPVWAWNDGVRSIYDTGVLMASGSVTWNGKSLVINYTAPYADLVHNGGYIQPYGNKSARPVYLPGRPWISAVLDGGGPVPQWNLADWLEANVGGLVG